MEFHVNSDPGLAYLDFVQRYEIDVSEYQIDTHYWEMVADGSTWVARQESRADMVSFIEIKKWRSLF